ncbi:proline-rich protein PRCC [Centruroides vittatus]|uniref:proline-rich protein PRCC n=1 Tax=Centruroides vittatus TaxID=120091 RepID=UPI00350EAFD9
MSLVQYDSSDEEEEETRNKREETNEIKNNSSIESLLANLPAPKLNTLQNVISEKEADDDFVKIKEISKRPSESDKKRKQPVKIVIPNLNEFPEEVPSKAKKSKVLSGLMDILPAPRNASVSHKTVSLVPHAVSKKVTETATVKKTKVKKNANTCLVAYDDKDSDNEEMSSQNDFFSLNLTKPTLENENLNVNDASERTSISEINKDSSTENSLNNTKAQLNFNPEQTDSIESSNIIIHEDQEFQIIETPITYEESVEIQPQEESSQSQEIDFNDERFLRLQGKKQRGKEEIQIIDISADQQLPNENLLIKNLTDESLYYSSKKKGKMPTAQQRRKHQITYLAFQAKERELELKNQWSKNRMTRRQTQAKYGF